MTESDRLIDEVLRLDESATKGPWYVQMDGGTIRTTDIDNETRGEKIGTTYFTSADAEHMVSNSHIIASYRSAAPRLARMLQVALEELEETARIQGRDGQARASLAEIERIAKGEA